MGGEDGAAPGPPCPAVVVGASAGGVEALRELARGLPPDLDAAVLVVLHLPERGQSRLAAILAKAGPLPAAPASSGAALEPGRVLVAPPDRHLLVQGPRALLSAGPRENGHRPAVDALFRSAARWLGPDSVAVVLSGVLDDGAAGAAAVAAQGGAVLVQDPAEALFDAMPQAARAAAPGAQVLRAGSIGGALPALLQAGRSRALPAPSLDLVLETDMAEMHESAVSGTASPGEVHAVSCPACHGVMSQVHTGQAVHFRCHVGHAYGPASLLQAQREASESALWTAVASLEEQVALHREVAELTPASTGRQEHLREADEAAAQARALRRQLRRPSA